MEGAKETGTDRIELYTEAYAEQFAKGNESAIEPYTKAAELANSLGLGVNAGHDLNLDNLVRFLQIPGIKEVSIGHGLTIDALKMGYKHALRQYLSLCSQSA